MRKYILLLCVIVVISLKPKNGLTQFFDFDSVYIIASSINYDYKNPNYSVRNGLFHFSSYDFLSYERWEGPNTSNIILRKFDRFQYFSETVLTNNNNALNINPIIHSPYDNYNLCYITWQSNINGNWDVYYAVYNDSTENLIVPPTLVDTNSANEINPHIATSGNRMILSYERNNDIYVKLYELNLNLWHPDTNITSMYSKPCRNHDMVNYGINWGIIFEEGENNESKMIRFDIFRILNSPQYYLRYNPDSLQTQSLNTYPNITNTLNFNEHSYVSGGKHKSRIITKNLNDQVISTESFPGNFYQGRVSIYPIITEGDPPHPFGFVRRQNDSSWVCFGSETPYEFSSYKLHYVSDSAYDVKMDISFYLINQFGIKYHAAWNKPVSGKDAIVGSHGLYFLSGLNQVSQNTVSLYNLHQNYPNPFNPNTSIKFEIPSSVRGEKSKVKLSVYDTVGKEVGVLVDSELLPGVYEYSFDGSGLGSGVYFYKLQSGDFIETRRMVLLK